MLHGVVSGEIWSSVQVPGLESQKMLIVQPLGQGHTNSEIVAVDLVSAGVGDHVIVALGQAARNALENPGAPIEAAIIGVVDAVQDASPTGPGSMKDVPKSPVKKKPSLKKKPRAKPSSPADETLDLFSGLDESAPEPDLEVQVEETDTDTEEVDPPGSTLPSIDDVDSIWGEFEEEEKGGT